MTQIWFNSGLRKFIYFFLFSEFSTSPSDQASAAAPAVRKTDELDLGFMNHTAAFKSKSTWQVFRGYLVYQLCSIGPLVENNEKVDSLKIRSIQND